MLLTDREQLTTFQQTIRQWRHSLSSVVRPVLAIDCGKRRHSAFPAVSDHLDKGLTREHAYCKHDTGRNTTLTTDFFRTRWTMKRYTHNDWTQWTTVNVLRPMYGTHWRPWRTYIRRRMAAIKATYWRYFLPLPKTGFLLEVDVAYVVDVCSQREQSRRL